MSITASEGVGSSSSLVPTSGTGTTPVSTSTTDSTAMNKDMFLKLMVSQLKNQDPMNPTDSSQFLAQTAQFSSLEKLEAMAAQSAQALSAQMAFGASGLVGKTITYVDAAGAEHSGAVSSVRFTSDGPLLGVGSDEVALANVSKVG